MKNNMKVKISTKSTYLGKGKWGCRVFIDSEPAIEVRVDNRQDMGYAFRDMLRTLDKMGYVDEDGMLHEARNRINVNGYKSFKFIWL